jgi:tetratricopeptide (TPR) repeat protein
MSKFVLKGVFAFAAVMALFAFKKSAFTSDGSLQQNMRACDAMAVQTRVTGCTELLARNSLSIEHRALAYLKRSNAYYALNDIDHAIADLEAASALTPDDYMPLHELAIAYRDKGETERAIETMDRAISINPKSAESFYHRGEMKRALDQFVEAEADYETAISLAPDDNKIAFIENGAITRATGNRLRANSYKELAKTYIFARQEAKAVETFDRAVNAFPNVGTFYALRASYYEYRDAERASADLDRAIALDPVEVRALTQRGRLAFTNGNYMAAAKDWAQAWQGNRGDLSIPEAYLPIWIYMLEARDDNAKATSGFERRVKEIEARVWPYPVASFYLGQVSVEDLDVAAADNDQKCEANFYVGEWHLLKGDVASARKRFEQAFGGCSPNLIERDMAEIEAKRLPGERGAPP